MNTINQETLDNINWGNIDKHTIEHVERVMGLNPVVSIRKQKHGPHFAAAVEKLMKPEEIEQMKQREREKSCFLGH